MFRSNSSTRSPWFHLLGSPIIWGMHFFVSYLWVETACQARLLVLDATILGLTVISQVVLALTLVAMIAACFVGGAAYRRWRELLRRPEILEDSRLVVEVERFMAFSGVALSMLFAPTILLTGLPALVLRPC